MLRRTFAVLLAVSLFAGCGGDSTEPKATITGTWNGTITTGGSSGTLTLTLTQAGTRVTGTGRWPLPWGRRR